MAKEVIHGKIVCYTNPTRFDRAPYGALFITIKNDKSTDIYIQTNKNQEKSNWESLGSFFDKALKDLIEDDEFKKLCIQRYEKTKNNSQENNSQENYSLINCLKNTAL